MPSLTTWSRLEPRMSGGNLDVAYAARLHDPLWLLTRQWQIGEFQGEDAGTPIVARWRARVKTMTRYQAGPIAANTPLDAPRFDADAMPLETRVERQPLHRSPTAPDIAGLRMAVESGQQFLRLLRRQVTTGDYGDAIRTAHAVPPLTDAQRPLLDPETVAYADLVAGRALDARRLRAAFGNPADPDLDPAFGILPGDRAEVAAAYRAWRAWEEGLFAEPSGAPADQTWQPDRMEYTFSVATRLDDEFGDRTLTAMQYADGTLDWYSFDVNREVDMGTGQDEPGRLVTRTVLPAPVTFHGMPAPRFWEFEDARIDLGSLQPGDTELGQVLLIETLTGYGNDWYVIPIDLPVGSLVASRSLVVTDTFGVQTLLRPTGDPELGSREGFSMFALAMPVDAGDATGVAVTNLFFLPASVHALEGPVLEEVVLMRDELANLGWAVERRLESPLEVGLETSHDPVGASESLEEVPRDVPVYRLASQVPQHWVPLIPVRLDPAEPEVRLARAAVLDLDGTRRVIEANAQILEVGEGRLLIREEEVPREGLVVRRSYQAARWHDGRLFVWAGNRVSVGRGETSSGLAFDALDT